jgi:hypothetical protein
MIVIALLFVKVHAFNIQAKPKDARSPFVERDRFTAFLLGPVERLVMTIKFETFSISID